VHVHVRTIAERRDRSASQASDKGIPGESRRRKATEATAQLIAPC
jgi:hypothetical protein